MNIGRMQTIRNYSYLPQNTSSTDNGLNNNGTLPQWLYRGYTGHEHLDEFALINMNARLYDPVVGMMLSPDNYIQAPGNTQNYNRYAYCLNNPLKYTDPSGNRFTSDDVGYMALGAAFGAASWQPIFKYSFGNLSTGQAVGLYAVNATAFVVSAGVGTCVSSSLSIGGFYGGAIIGGTSGFTGGFIQGFGSSLVNGNNLNDALIIGSKNGIIGAATGAITTGLFQGIQSYRNEGSFWTGKGQITNLYADESSSLASREIDSDLEYNNECLDQFSEDYFECKPENLNSQFADGSCAEGYSNDGWHFSKGGRKVIAQVRNIGNGKFNAYFSKSAFVTKEELYLAIGHEYIHIDLFSSGITDTELYHGIISEWEYRQSFAFNSTSTSSYKSIFINYRNWNCTPKQYSYQAWGPSIKYSIPW